MKIEFSLNIEELEGYVITATVMMFVGIALGLTYVSI